MRIRNIITLLLLSLLATACNTDKGDAESVVPTPVELVIRASQGVTTRASVVEDPEIVVGADLATADLAADPVAPDTRTELGTATYSELPIHWSGPVKSDVPGEDKPGDQIMVWAKPNSDATVGYAFERTVFSLAHFNYTYSSADFTAVVANTMDKDYTYTYHAIYPSPRSRKLSGSSYTESAVDGITMNTDGTVTYSLPTTQTGDYNGAYDIMRGTATGAALNDSSDADNSIWPQPELRMQHLMHLMRIRVPEDRNLMGRSIKRLEITFPQEIVGGTVTFNPTDPTAAPTWSDQSAKVTIDFDDTNLLDAAGRDVWIFVKPGTINGEISFQAYDTAGVPAAAISTTVVKTLQSQHITPIALTIPSSLYPVTYLKITETANNLGEAWNTMTLSNATFVKPFTLETTNSLGVTPNTTKVYEVAIAAEPSTIQGKSIAASYDSPNAIVSNSIVLPSTISNKQANVNNQVPYLLFEDFSRIVNEEESYGNNDYASSDRNQPGKSLSQLPGWNAARFWAKPSSMRINVRFQRTTVWASTHYGRLDSPQLQLLGLKNGKSVNLILKFDAGAYHHKSSSITINSTTINVTTHTISSNPIDGIPTGATGLFSKYDTTEADFGTKHYSGLVVNTYGENDFGQTFPTHQTNINSVNSNTRICFYPSVSQSSTIRDTGNCESNVYLDNIKVSIAQ